jgi:hypothetical protein
MFPIGSMLTLKKHGGRLVLSPSISFRILFAVLFALSVFTLFSGVLFDGEPTVLTGRNTVPILLVAVTCIALLYDERWIFDARAGTMESRFGLLVIFRGKRIPFSEISEIMLATFTKGRLSPAASREEEPSIAARPSSGRSSWLERRIMPGMARLVAVDAQGEARVIDTAKAARIESLRLTGKRIAEYCGLSFRESAV